MNRLTDIRSWIVVLAVSVLMVGVAATGISDAAGGTLVYGLSAEPPNLDPHVQSGTAARTVKLTLYRGLVSFQPDGSLRYDLAESITQLDDRSYLVNLREGVLFHNGTPVTAEDVAYSLERMTDPSIGAHLSRLAGVIETVDILDDHTLVITLSRPLATFLLWLALPEGAIVSKEFAENNDLRTTPMGAGPFKMASWNRGIDLTVEKFDGYFRPDRPYLDAVRFIFYPDSNLRVTALKTGEVDIVDYVPWEEMDAIDMDPDLVLDGTAGPFQYLIFNTSREPFNNPLVRQAIARGIDRQPIIRAAFFGRGEPIYGSLLRPGHWAYSDDIANAFTYDPEEAKRLLAEAGYPNGFSARLLTTSQYEMHQMTAVVVQAELKKIGIDVTLDLVDWATQVSRGNAAEYDFAVIGTSAEMNDPDFYSQFYQSGPVRFTQSAHFKDEHIDALLEVARTELDEARRAELYREIEQRALELMPIVPLVWRVQAWAYKDSVEGFETYPGFLNFFSALSLEYTSMKR